MNSFFWRNCASKLGHLCQKNEFNTIYSHTSAITYRIMRCFKNQNLAIAVEITHLISLLVIFVYLLSLPVAHQSDAPGRRLIVTGDSARIQDKTTRIPPGSLTCSAYSAIIWDTGVKPRPKDY